MAVTIILAVLLVTGAWLGYYQLTSPERIRATAEAYLQRYVNGRVSVGSAAWSYADGVYLYDVVVTPERHAAGVAMEPMPPPTTQGEGATESPDPVFMCNAVRLTANYGWLLLGQPKIEAVVATKPTCRIVRNKSSGGTNLTGLFRFPEPIEPPHSPALFAGPTIELRDARVQVLIRESGEDRLVEDLTLTVRARPSPTADMVYDVVWSDQAASWFPAQAPNADTEATGRVDPLESRAGNGQLDLRTGALRNIRGGLPWISIEAVMAALNTHYDAAGAWCDLLGLAGTVRVTDYRFEPRALGDDLRRKREADSGEHVGRGGGAARPRSSAEATIELSGASVSIPVNEAEHAVSPTQRYLRFDDVDGRAVLTPDHIRAEFSGRFHGSECKVSAVLHGGLSRPATLENAAFDAHLAIEALELPQPDQRNAPTEARFIQRWHSLARFYHDFAPSGRADVELDVTKRAGTDQPIKVRHAMLTAVDGAASYRRFPYPLEDLRGSIEFSPARVTIHGLSGVHQDGKVRIDGWVDRPARSRAPGGKELTIIARGVPIDPPLLAALPSRYASAVEQFAPQGRFDAQVKLSQQLEHVGAESGTPPQKPPWKTKAEIVLRDIAAEYAKFPYPVERITGSLLLSGDRLEFTDLAGTAGTARVQLDGIVAMSQEGIASLDVSLRAQDVSLDDALLSALPAVWRTQLEPWHARGRIDVDQHWEAGRSPSCGRTNCGDAKTNADRPVTHATRVRLADVTVCHDKFPIEITGITGTLQFSPGRFVAEDVRGACGEGSISVEGSGRFWPGGPSASGEPPAVPVSDPDASTELMVRTRNVSLDDETRAVLPPDLRSALVDWTMNGDVRTDTTVSTGAADGGTHMHLRTVVQLEGASVRHAALPAPFSEVHGELVLDQEGVRGEHLQARYGPATLIADLNARRTADGWVDKGSIVIRATQVAFDETLRGLLPAKLARKWDRFKPAGSANVHIDALCFQRSNPGGPRGWTVAGYAELNDVAFREIGNVSRLSGTLVGSGTLKDRHGGTMLSGTLTASSLAIWNQHVRRAEADWSFVRAADGEGALELQSVAGKLHGGTLQGEVLLGFDDRRTEWGAKVTVHSMRVRPLVSDMPAAAMDSKTVESVGSLLGNPVGADGPALADSGGFANGHLYLTGVMGDPTRQRGGGRFEIQDARLYRLPLMAAILHVLNLSIPDEEVLDDARAEFFVVGNRLELKDIVLRGGALSLVGSGSLSIPDRGLDLSLVNVSPHRWARVPVLAEFVEGASRELVELHVTGPLSSPTVRARPFRGISDEFKRIFQKKKSRKTADVPASVGAVLSEDADKLPYQGN